jgi:hypothetical protein
MQSWKLPMIEILLIIGIAVVCNLSDQKENESSQDNDNWGLY